MCKFLLKWKEHIYGKKVLCKVVPDNESAEHGFEWEYLENLRALDSENDDESKKTSNLFAKL